MSERLRIGMLAPLWAPVPPATYGGIERHLALLIEELVERGHEVTLYASGDSRTRASLRPVVARSVAESMDRGEAYLYEPYVNASLAEALGASEALDLLHLHLGTAAVPLAELAQCPVLHSLHTGITRDDLWVLERFPETHFTALTHRQLATVPEARRARIDVVPYGFDFASCAARSGPGAHLVFLGRMAPHKAPDAAIEVARAAGRPIRLAGAPVTAEDREWFDREIKPRIDGRQVAWLGPVDDAGKDELFRDAAALVFPIRWEEPFGLVMLEALARGVPVLATPRGSVPEVIEAGVTGFVGEGVEALAQHVEAAAALDGAAVRQRAAERFSAASMVDAYQAAYRRARRPR